MARMKGITEENMNADQKKVAAAMKAGPRGHAAGLMGLWLHNPELAARTQKVGEFLRFMGTLPGPLTELTILMVAREWRCYHEWLVHAPIAEKKGLSSEIIAAVRDRRQPVKMSGDERAVHAYVGQMLTEHRVTDEAFEEIRSRFGAAGIIELAGIIGHYIIGACTLNAVEFDLPDGVEAPF